MPNRRDRTYVFEARRNFVPRHATGRIEVVDGVSSNSLLRIFQEIRHFRRFSLHRKRETQSGSRHLITLNLAVGTSDFTCCQRNHIFGDRVVPCDRGITRKILEGMIKAKVQHFFKLEHTLQARLCACFTNWWLRVESAPEESHSESLDSFQESFVGTKTTTNGPTTTEFRSCSTLYFKMTLKLYVNYWTKEDVQNRD